MSKENEIRTRLGVPGDADEVVIVCESTHWDPDWLLTSSEYLRLMVAPTIDRALDALEAEPRRVYSMECAFFPARYLQLRPERHDQFVRLANEGRLHFTGSGVTTPDTLLPEDELLLRDLLEGSRWLSAQGISRHPRTLYLPDSFGHSPGVPTLLEAAGIEHAGICRIDGMRFPGAELEAADHFPWPDTSAARLVEEGTADFLWRAPDGATVLTHWHALGYGHADMIGHGGFTRAMGLPLAWPSRNPGKVAARIEGFLADLRPLARTPYRLLTIGFDFSRPVTRLTELLDAWNSVGYQRTGAWLVNATQDDYFDLISGHLDELPIIELDPNPYWTGFYATRPALKRACRDLGRDLIALDAARTRSELGREADGRGETRPDRCDEARWTAAAMNHHDLITGTSPDRTVRLEQRPWLEGATHQIRREISHRHREPDRWLGPVVETEPTSPAVIRDGFRVTVTTAHFTAVFDEYHGGALCSLVDVDGNELVIGRALSCVAIAERGGLWRMGLEFPGGRWEPVDATEDHPASVTVQRVDAGMRAVIATVLEARPVELVVDFPDASASIVVTSRITPRLRRTVCLAWNSGATTEAISMHQPGAVVARPTQRRFSPTFWPLHSWAVNQPASAETTKGLAIATAVPTALWVQPDGMTSVVVARSALRELAWGVVPLLGPAWGYERGVETAQLAFGWHDPSTPLHRTGRILVDLADRASGRQPAGWSFTVDDPDVEIISEKPADRGSGVIVRLRNWRDSGNHDTCSIGIDPGAGAVISRAWRCDSHERDLEELSVTDGHVEVVADRHLFSLRILC